MLDVLSVERSFYVGNLISTAFLGTQFCMCVHTCHLLANDKSTPFWTRIFYATYSIVMLLTSFLSLIPSLILGDLMWLVHRDDPEGPFGYFMAETPVNLQLALIGTVTVAVQTYLNDALLLYRCYVMYCGSRRVIAFPSLLYLLSIATGVTSFIENEQTNGSQFTLDFTLIWLISTAGLNIILTLLIIGRIFKFSFSISSRKYLSPVQNHFGIVSILVESALIYSVAGVLYAATFGQLSPIVLAAGDIWGTAVAVSPQLIILRVAMGRAWKHPDLESIDKASGIAFASKAADVETPALP